MCLKIFFFLNQENCYKLLFQFWPLDLTWSAVWGCTSVYLVLGSRCVLEKLRWKQIFILKNKSLKWLEVKKKNSVVNFVSLLCSGECHHEGHSHPKYRHTGISFFSTLVSLVVMVVCSVYQRVLKWGIHPTFTAKYNNSPLKIRGRFSIFDDP